MAESIVQLSSLRGEKLTSVRFAENFVEFEFSGQVIRSLTNVELHVRGFRIDNSEDGCRDAFCSLLGDSVADLELTAEPVFNLSFSSGARISISLQTAHHLGLEGMQFTKYGRLVVVW